MNEIVAAPATHSHSISFAMMEIRIHLAISYIMSGLCVDAFVSCSTDSSFVVLRILFSTTCAKTMKKQMEKKNTEKIMIVSVHASVGTTTDCKIPSIATSKSAKKQKKKQRNVNTFTESENILRVDTSFFRNLIISFRKVCIFLT